MLVQKVFETPSTNTSYRLSCRTSQGRMGSRWTAHPLFLSVWGKLPTERGHPSLSRWQLRVTIWSLVTGTATYIQYPSHSDSGEHLDRVICHLELNWPGHDFSPDGRYLAVAERHRSKDSVGIYDALDSYKLARVHPCWKRAASDVDFLGSTSTFRHPPWLPSRSLLMGCTWRYGRVSSK